MSDFIRKGNKPYGVVPFALIECKAMSPMARLVAVWIESKPEGWKVRPGVLQESLGISEKLWLKARKEMIAAGIFIHEKRRTVGGKWHWESVFDASRMHEAIAQTDSESLTIPPFSAHGKAADIEVRDQKKEQRQRQTSTMFAGFTKTKKTEAQPPEHDLEKLKKLHIGWVLNSLGIDWYDESGYVKFDNSKRARADSSGHWLWVEPDRTGDSGYGGSSIDLIKEVEGVDTACAIARLQCIYDDAIAQSESKKAAGIS